MKLLLIIKNESFASIVSSVSITFFDDSVTISKQHPTAAVINQVLIELHIKLNFPECF